MIGIDTNVLLRFLTQDDLQQAQIAEDLISKYYHKEKSILINNIVICEIIWVLEKGYEYSKKQIKDALKSILSTMEFTFENLEILWVSLEEYEKYNTDFSDILIGNLNLSLNCSTTLTFDKKTSNLQSFQKI